MLNLKACVSCKVSQDQKRPVNVRFYGIARHTYLQPDSRLVL